MESREFEGLYDKSNKTCPWFLDSTLGKRVGSGSGFEASRNRCENGSVMQGSPSRASPFR
jgi:hypothetical protein